MYLLHKCNVNIRTKRIFLFVGGICIDKLASYLCACAAGYTGGNCEEEVMLCDDSPCHNNALCLMEVGTPVCYCVPDFHGEKCEHKYNECELMSPR